MKIGFLSHLDLNLYLFRAPIMQELVKKGYSVFAICPPGDYSEPLKQMGIEVVHYNIERGSLNVLKELKAVTNIYHAIKNLDLDIIHTFTAKPNIYGTFAARRAKVPIILNLVEGLGSFYIENTLKNKIIKKIMELLYQQAFKLSNLTIFVNSDDPQYMIDQGIIDLKKVKVIKSVGIDTELFNPENIDYNKLYQLRKELNLLNKTIILMVARAIWHKGIKEFYEASEIYKDRDDIQFILVGDIDEGNPSAVPVSYLHNNSVLWLGHRDDILELTAMSDIYVLPSYREGVPRTLLEAASMGKAIVTTDVVGCREVVQDGWNGYLVPPKNSEALYKAIERLLLDKTLRLTMGQRSRKKAIEEFDTKKIVREYLNVYQNFETFLR